MLLQSTIAHAVVMPHITFHTLFAAYFPGRRHGACKWSRPCRSPSISIAVSAPSSWSHRRSAPRPDPHCRSYLLDIQTLPMIQSSLITHFASRVHAFVGILVGYLRSTPSVLLTFISHYSLDGVVSPQRHSLLSLHLAYFETSGLLVDHLSFSTSCSSPPPLQRRGHSHTRCRSSTRIGAMPSLPPQLENVASFSEAMQDQMHQHCMRDLTELVRLYRLDSGLADELKEMLYLKQGLRSPGRPIRSSWECCGCGIARLACVHKRLRTESVHKQSRLPTLQRPRT